MKTLGRLRDKPWLWSWIAALAVWLATMAFTQGQGGLSLLTAALTFATFFVIVGIGQMFVFTLGPGNVDLSIPATMTLAGSVAMKIMDTQDSMILVGLAAALACGLAVGIFNYALILLLRIPPIIATLSAAFVVQSAAIAYGRGLRIKPPQMLADFTTAQVAGIPVLAIFVALLAAAMSVVLHRTVYGRSVTAIGQSPRAADRAGIPVERIRFLTYVMCALLAALSPPSSASPLSAVASRPSKPSTSRASTRPSRPPTGARMPKPPAPPAAPAPKPRPSTSGSTPWPEFMYAYSHAMAPRGRRA
jgi:ribose transport system permease protein